VTVSLTVLYHQPEDAAAFDRYYADTHAPLAAKLPGLQSYTYGTADPGPDGSTPQYHVVAVLTWASPEEMQAALRSDAGRATTRDMANFAQAGATTLIGRHQQVV